MNPAAIPTFALYGEDGWTSPPGFGHIETIAARSALHDWTIAPHRHDAAAQVLIMAAGNAEVTIDGSTFAIAAPGFLVVAAGSVHAFRFAPDSRGHVLTLGQDFASRWARADDPLARHLIDLEREWALLACATGENRAAYAKAFLDRFIAPDFVGTAPDGSTYTRTDMTSPAALSAEPEKDCKMLSGKVRWFGPDLAVIYGSESAIINGPDGRDTLRKLVWTDTIARHGAKWQAIAVQDMVVPVK